MNTTKKSLLAAMVGLFAAGGMGTVQAQAQEQVGESARAQGVLDEIVVTATKRETSLSDTPQSIAVVGGSDIQRKNLAGIDDYLRFLPGFNVIPAGPGRSPVIIRGLSVDPEFEGVRSGPTVGTYFGEAPLSGLGMFGGTTDIKLVDIERVEALRGPQGTLFGSNSLTGAIRNIPVAPNLESIEGSVKAGYSLTSDNGGGNNKIEAAINIPVVEDYFAIRGVLYKHDDSGYVDNIAGTDSEFSDLAAVYGAEGLAINEKEVGDTEYKGVRIAGLWQPRSDLRVTLSHVVQKGEQEGRSEVQGDSVGYTQTRLQFGELTAPAGVKGDPGITAEGLIDEFKFFNLVVEYDLGWGEVVSSTLDYHGEATRGFDALLFLGGPIVFSNVHETDSIIQELRLTSSLDGAMQFIAGLYYEETDILLESLSHWTGDLDLFPLLGFGDIPEPFGGEGITQIDYNIEDKKQNQRAVFGEFSYEINEQIKLTLGARWYEYKRDNKLGGFGVFSGDTMKVLKSKESGTNLMMNVAYTPDDDVLLYGRYAEGFRPGNTQDAIPDFCDADNDGILDGTSTAITESFSPDELENYEIGAKLGLMDGQLQVNAALYHINWEGLPTSVVSPTCFFSVLENAGEARSRGFEVEVMYQLSENINMNFGGGYVDAELREGAEGLGASSGDRLIGSPKHNFNIGVSYDFLLGEQEAYIRGDYSYVGGFYNNFKEEGEELGDYGQLNAGFGVAYENFDFSIFGTNLTDENSFTWIDSVFDPRANILRPRTIGGSITYSF